MNKKTRKMKINMTMKGKQEVLVSSNCCITTVFNRVNLTHCDMLLKGEDESQP